MARPRKPVPKSQREISESLQKATDPVRGNPNAKVNPNESETGIEFNRSTKLSFRDDTTKPFSIGIQDLDEAVFYYFKNVIQPFVYQMVKELKYRLYMVLPKVGNHSKKMGTIEIKTGQ